MASVKTYSVYVKMTDRDFLENAEIVEEKFSFFAFLLPMIWSLFNRVWWFAAVTLAFNILLIAVLEERNIPEEIKIIPEVAFMLIAGFCAADWKSKSLLKKGYQLRQVIVAESPDVAHYKFFNKELRSGQPVII